MDDGAAAHLEGLVLPELGFPGTGGSSANLAGMSGRWVLSVYPMTGRPDIPLPEGWDAFPGARGCTPQACSFRDPYSELKSLNTDVFGLSGQTSEYQREARDRLHLPFQLLSDSSLQLKQLLSLQTFTACDIELYRGLTLIVQGARIVKVFYPVYTPEHNAEDVLDWLRRNPQSNITSIIQLFSSAGSTSTPQSL